MDRRENAGIFRSSARAGQVHSVTMSQDAGCDLMPEKKEEAEQGRAEKEVLAAAGRRDVVVGCFWKLFFIFVRKVPFSPAESTRMHDDVDTR